MDEASYNVLNSLLTNAFNEINKVEERSVKLATGDKLSITEVHTLEAVGTKGCKSMSEIAAKLRIAVSTLTISVNRLVNKGYVQRSRANEDRRIVKVALTEEGVRIVENHGDFHRKMIYGMLKTLNENEISILTASVRNLLSFLNTEDELVTQLLLEQEKAKKPERPDDIIGVENLQEIPLE